MKTRKIMSLLLVAVLLVTGSFFANADSIILYPTPILTGLTEASSRLAANNYMSQRENYLLGDTTALDGFIVGIKNDELAHMECISDQNIIRVATQYSVDNIKCFDTHAEVTVVETLAYTKNGVSGTEDIVHILNIYLNEENVPAVYADTYIESYSGFVSCSYVNESSVQINSAIVGGNGPCLVHIAQQEIGYEETPTDITKYGAWNGMDGQGWCASFVTWCANEANISTDVICKTASPYQLCLQQRNASRFYYSTANGGDYTPQAGDLYFLGAHTGNVSHVGIVVSVDTSSGTMTVIDGNWADAVRSRNVSLAASDLLGYGNPNYPSNSHTFGSYTSDATYHWQVCTNCDYTSTKISHIFVQESNGGQYICRTCGRKSVAVELMNDGSCAE